MKIKCISFEENMEKDNYWKLETCKFKNINLIVGKNATGKSRTISLISTICKILAGEKPKALATAKYDLELENGNDTYRYYLEFDNQIVVSEYLEINGVRKLTKKHDGSGEVYFSELGTFVKFKMPQETIAITQQNDELQHPYLSDLISWASNVDTCLFGSDLLQRNLVGTTVSKTLELDYKKLADRLPNGHPLKCYILAYEEFGEEYDLAIIKDMEKLGYNIKDVGCDFGALKSDSKDPQEGQAIVLGLYVVEEELGFTNHQHTLSQGMYRALVLTIKLNYLFFKKQDTLLLVDDVGEGLDYSRAKRTIELLVEKFKNMNAQIIMTSNDEFTMNHVPLENWTILTRKGHVVKSYNKENSAQEFDDFKFMGMNNFDFFTSDIFENK